MRADRTKMERLLRERTDLMRQVQQLDEEIAQEQSRCSCPELQVMPNGEKQCPDCFFVWSTD